VRGVRHRYGIVFVLVVVSFVVQEAAPDTDLTRVVVIWLQAATLVAAVRIARESRRLVQLAAAVAALVAVAAPVLWVVEGSVGDGVTAIATGLLVAVAPPVIAVALSRDLLRSGEVTVETLSGVLSIYLLAGMFFSFLFAAVQAIGDDPFFAEIADPDRSDFLYFSYTTLTSTGFGDLTAATNLGRTLTSIEALVGTIYLVTIVALIVSNLRPRRRAPGAAPAEEDTGP
jgi:Ion channel